MPDVAETLHDLQVRFAQMLADLIIWCHTYGYEVAFGEVSRSDEQAEINAMGFADREELCGMILARFPLLAEKIKNNGKAGGIRNSLHGLSLAADLKLFMNGVYLTRTEDYRPAGEYWEKQGGTWGGRFSDGNHFSLAYKGRK